MVGAALVGAIIQFREKIQYVDDENLSDYFPELNEEEMENPGWEKIIEKLFPLNKCPSNPEALGYVTMALMAGITQLFQDPDFVIEQKDVAQKELSLEGTPLDLDRFIDGLNAGYERFDRFGLEDANGNSIDPPEEELETIAEVNKDFFEKADNKDAPLRDRMRENMLLRISELEAYTTEKDGAWFEMDKWSLDLGYIMTMNFAIGEISRELKKRAHVYGDEEMLQGEYQSFLHRCIDKLCSQISHEECLEEIKENSDVLNLIPAGLDTSHISISEFTIGAGEVIGFLETELSDTYDVDDNNPDNPTNNKNTGFDFDSLTPN